MPIIWRYLLGQYLKVLFFCLAAFIALLLTLRLEEIAHFATLGPEGFYILLFICYQIPYVLPIAMPVSALISSIILIQRLSQTHELTALRASGLALKDILAPILLAAAFLTMLNFYVISELATHSHLETSLIKKELRSINPLLMLSNKHLMKLKGIYFDTLGTSRMGESASDIVLAMPNKSNNRVNVVIAENLQASSTKFRGQGVTLITSLSSEKEDHYDHLMLENIGEATTSVRDFAQLVQKKVWTLNDDHLGMPLLLIRLKDYTLAKQQALAQSKPSGEVKQIQRRINRIYSEIIRRCSVALAVFSFTFMGAAFGVSISRNRTHKGVICVIVLAALYLSAYFSAVGIDHLLIASAMLYLVPQALIIGLSLWMLSRVSKGVE